MPEWSLLIAAGIILIILGFFVVISSVMYESAHREERGTERSKEQERENKVRGGGVILIGPIPIVFGTDKRYALILMVLAIVIMLLAIISLK